MATKQQLLKQIKIHMKSNIISVFVDGEDGDENVKSISDPIVEVLLFIDKNENRLDLAAGNMYNQFQKDGELDELETAEADWYREQLYDVIPYQEIVEYISNLSR